MALGQRGSEEMNGKMQLIPIRTYVFHADMYVNACLPVCKTSHSLYSPVPFSNRASLSQCAYREVRTWMYHVSLSPPANTAHVHTRAHPGFVQACPN